MSDKQSETPSTKTITCGRCAEEHELSAMMHETVRRPGLIEVYMQCPACRHRLHVYFDSPELRHKRGEVTAALQAFRQARTPAAWEKYNLARNVYRRQFDRHNRQWRRKFGMYKEGAGHGVGI